MECQDPVDKDVKLSRPYALDPGIHAGTTWDAAHVPALSRLALVYLIGYDELRNKKRIFL
jgi:hypothetical protein